MPVFLRKSFEVSVPPQAAHLHPSDCTILQLTTTWKKQFAADPNSPQTIQVMSWLSRVTLDIIGLAGLSISCPVCFHQVILTMFQVSTITLIR